MLVELCHSSAFDAPAIVERADKKACQRRAVHRIYQSTQAGQRQRQAVTREHTATEAPIEQSPWLARPIPRPRPRQQAARARSTL